MTWSYTTADSIFSNGTGTVGNYNYWDYLHTIDIGTTTTSPWQSNTIYSYIQEIGYGQRGQEYNIHNIPSEPVQPSPGKLKEESEAKERAKNLLLEYLDEENKQRLLNNKPLEIASKLFNDIRYHIPLSKLGRIKALRENKIITELCILVREDQDLPIEDVVLTKLLHTLNDEGNMLVTANHSGVKENLLELLNCPIISKV